LIDVPRPIKRNLSEYAGIEARLAYCMGERFGFNLVNLPRAVKEVDERMLFTEKRDLMRAAPVPWGVAQGVSSEPYAMRITPWGPHQAKRAFLAAASALGIK
jgi:hypothetical protein